MLSQLPLPLQLLLTNGAAALRRHPRRVSAAVLMALGGSAVTAFGIAPMAPDAALLPQRNVIEEVAVEGLSQQLESLAGHQLELHRSTVSRKNDTADSLLKRLGVIDAVASAHLRRHPDARKLLDGDAGKLVQARAASDGSLIELVARFQALEPGQALTHFTRLTIKRDASELSTIVETAALQTQVRLGSATVRGSLWIATEQARLPDAIAEQMVDIFAGDIDFHREIKRGDAFSVVYESLTADDQPITWNEGTGRVLAAEYRNKGRRFQALWYTDPDTGRGAYYTFDGKSRRKPFLASPVDFSKVTSGFAMRIHPIAQTWRQHNGVDYSAPTGTPVKTVGDGTVEFAGRQNGYGNVVQIKHAGNKSTLYAHLSEVFVKEGQAVSQGDKVGAVGATGWATGPHLHFEFKVNGQYVDPLEYAGSDIAPKIDANERPRFVAWSGQIRHKLAAAESIAGFRGDAE